MGFFGGHCGGVGEGVYGGVGPLAAVPFGNAAGPYRGKGVAGRFAPPADGSLLEVPSGLMYVRLSETQCRTLRSSGAGLSP